MNDGLVGSLPRRDPRPAAGGWQATRDAERRGDAAQDPLTGINEAKRRAERRPAAGAVSSLEDAPIDDAPDWSEAPERRAERGDLRRVLEDAVRSLPIEYRAPLILRDVEGLSTQEAAEVMELGEAAFKSRLHRARLAVRRAIDQYYLEAER